MALKSLLFIFLLFPFFCFSQDINRVLIDGTITAPIGEDIEGVTIYNKSSQKGAITDEEGSFQIEVGVNDRVLITAMQYQTFTVIVDSGVVDSKSMNVYLNPSVNKLEEIIIRPYDLSGNVRADVGSIETNVIIPGWDLSWETMEFEYDFSDDPWSSIRGNKAEEAYFNDQKLNDQVSIIGIIGLLFPKKNSISLARELEEKSFVRGGLKQRFPKYYVMDTFDIPEEEYGFFVYFVEDAGLEQRLLKEENTVELLEFLFQQSELYKAQRENE